MGQLVFNLGTVEYDMGTHTPVPLEAQVGLAAGAAVVVLIVLVIILMYRYVARVVPLLFRGFLNGA